MLNKTLLIFITLFLFGCYMPEPLTNKIQVYDIHSNKEEKDYPSVLIVHAGYSIDRIVMENIADELKKKLEKVNVKVSSDFLADDTSRTGFYIAKLANENQVHAILMIVPLQRGVYTDANDVSMGFSRRSAIIRQRYALRMFDLGSQEKPIWEGRINASVEINKKYSYSEIVNEIIKRFKANLIWRDRFHS